MPTPHPSFPRLFAALHAGAHLGPWSGPVLRATAPRWVSKPYRLTGAGALQSGGRWNLPKLTPAVYFATSVETLNAEAEAWARRYGWTVADLKTQTRITVQLQLQSVLDLTTAPTLAALGLTLDELTRCDWKAEQDATREALTQAVARAAFEQMAEGLVAPSARHAGGVTVVVFPPHRRDGSSLLVPDEANIPLVHGL